MTAIGIFTATPEGFEGRLRTLTLDVPLIIVQAEPGTADKAPDYRVMAGEGDAAYEVGAGWKHIGERAGAFVTLVIDDPGFTVPLRANLFAGDAGTHLLTWSRPGRGRPKA
jgi:uncharacterized protein (DUF736 family)